MKLSRVDNPRKMLIFRATRVAYSQNSTATYEQVNNSHNMKKYPAEGLEIDTGAVQLQFLSHKIGNKWKHKHTTPIQYSAIGSKN